MPDYIACAECGIGPSELLTCEGCDLRDCGCEVRNTGCGSARCGDPDANLCDGCLPVRVGCPRCQS